MPAVPISFAKQQESKLMRCQSLSGMPSAVLQCQLMQMLGGQVRPDHKWWLPALEVYTLNSLPVPYFFPVWARTFQHDYGDQ